MDQVLYIRKLTHLDWEAIDFIYKEGVFIGNATLESKVPSWYNWNKCHHGQCRFVVELNKQIVAFGAIANYSESLYFSGVAQLEMYVSKGYQNHGIGSQLLERIIRVSETFNFWSIQAQILASNQKAISFMKKKIFELLVNKKK